MIRISKGDSDKIKDIKASLSDDVLTNNILDFISAIMNNEELRKLIENSMDFYNSEKNFKALYDYLTNAKVFDEIFEVRPTYAVRSKNEFEDDSTYKRVALKLNELTTASGKSIMFPNYYFPINYETEFSSREKAEAYSIPGFEVVEVYR